MGDKWTAFKNITWCVIDAKEQPPIMVCKRCGASEIYRLPMRIIDSYNVMRKFAKKHQHCKDPEIDYLKHPALANCEDSSDGLCHTELLPCTACPTPKKKEEAKHVKD